jgi:2-methylaconitate cis-trans-isomerase PrpF
LVRFLELTSVGNPLARRWRCLEQDPDMSFFHHDRNNEQMLAPITLIRGGTSRGFYFEGRNVPQPGKGLEEFLLAVRGSPDPMGMDGLGGVTVLQSKAAIVSPSLRSDADVDYTFVQMFPDQPTGISYKLNCGNISAGVPVFALMKNMIREVSDGRITIRAFSTNTNKMMYMTLDVLNGEARVEGETAIDRVPGAGAEILVGFRDQGGGFTGKLFPTGRLVDSIAMSDGSSIDVTIVDMVNLCAFFDAASFGIGCTGLELPTPSGAVVEPRGMKSRTAELRLKVAELIGWKQYSLESIQKAVMPFAVSVTGPRDYKDLEGDMVSGRRIDLVARFYVESVMHTAAPGSGSTCLAAAASIPGTIPNRILAEGGLRAGKGGNLTFVHPSGRFSVMSEPILAASPSDIAFRKLAFPRTASSPAQ